MAGLYTRITIVVPFKAPAGSLVEVNVNVANITTGSLYLLCAVMLDGEYLSVTPSSPWLAPANVTSVFTARFTMPNRNVLLAAESFVLIGPTESDYILDDSQQNWVYLGEAPPPPPPPPPAEPQFRNLAVILR